MTLHLSRVTPPYSSARTPDTRQLVKVQSLHVTWLPCAQVRRSRRKTSHVTRRALHVPSQMLHVRPQTPPLTSIPLFCFKTPPPTPPTSSQLITPLCLQPDNSHCVSVAVDASRASSPLKAHCENVQSVAVNEACDVIVRGWRMIDAHMIRRRRVHLVDQQHAAAETR